MADRTNAPSFVYLDTVPAVERVHRAHRARARARSRHRGGELPSLRRPHLPAAALDARRARRSSIRCRSGTPAGLGALLEDPDRSRSCSTTPTTTCACSQQDYGWHVRQHLRHAHRRAAARLHGVRARGAARAVLRREARQEAPARRLVDAPAHRRTCSTTRRRTRATCWSCKDLMSAELERMGRMAWAREEFGAARGDAVGRRGAGDGHSSSSRAPATSTRRELAVLRELVPWRDAVAAAARPRHLPRARQRAAARSRAHAAAVRATRSAKIKGMPRGILEQRGAELLDAVTRALAVPESELPRFPQGGALGPRSRLRRPGQRAQDGARRGGASGSTSIPACSARATGWRPWRAGTRRRWTS